MTTPQDRSERLEEIIQYANETENWMAEDHIRWLLSEIERLEAALDTARVYLKQECHCSEEQKSWRKESRCDACVGLDQITRIMNGDKK